MTLTNIIGVQDDGLLQVQDDWNFRPLRQA